MSADAPLSEGQLVAGRYRLEREIGKGGMGTVWRAHAVGSGLVVALKRLSPRLAPAPGAPARLRREALVASALRHPNVVRIHEIVGSGEELFLVMELVGGVSLRAILGEIPQPLARTLAILHQMADALASAHAIGFVHRDVKPENVMIEPQPGRPERA